MSKRPIYIHSDDGLKKVGFYREGDKSYHSPRKKSIHYFRKEDGWAIDKVIFEGLSKSGLEFVVINSVEEKKKYTAPAEAFRKYGKHINYGYGEQIVLNSQYWTESIVE